MRVKLQLFPTRKNSVLINVEELKKKQKNGENTTIIMQAGKINNRIFKLVGEGLE